MEKLRRVVNQIAYSPNPTLSPLHRSLIPFLSLASSVYRLAISLRRLLYGWAFFSKKQLPLPVISVGNLTWGGNGKTPMVEFISLWLSNSGIQPLILTRGYAGGDEAKMLGRHFANGAARIGVGGNRTDVAADFLRRYGYIDPQRYLADSGKWLDGKLGAEVPAVKIGAVVLDDGMQHWSLHRDIDIVMVNGMAPWGNHELLPLGPLREPLTALQRADIAIIHNADLVTEQTLDHIKLTIQQVKECLPVFCSRMCPSHLFEVGNINSRTPLHILQDKLILCVSAIGSAAAFVQGVEKMGALYVDRIDFSDHHAFQPKDVKMIRMKLIEMEENFGCKPVVIITEKDYDRDPEILNQLRPSKVMALCSELQIICRGGQSEESFQLLLKNLMKVKFHRREGQNKVRPWVC